MFKVIAKKDNNEYVLIEKKTLKEAEVFLDCVKGCESIDGHEVYIKEC